MTATPAPTKLDIMEARAKQNHPYTRQKDGEVHVSLDGSNWWVYYGKNAMSPEDNPTAGQQESDELNDCITMIVGAATIYEAFKKDEDGIALRQYIENLKAIAERLATRRAVEELEAVPYINDRLDVYIQRRRKELTATLTEGDAK